MPLISRLEQATVLDPVVSAGQRADWSEQHEQQMRVGVVHAVVNALATG
jgi:hypothetical protein